MVPHYLIKGQEKITLMQQKASTIFHPLGLVKKPNKYEGYQPKKPFVKILDQIQQRFIKTMPPKKFPKFL